MSEKEIAWDLTEIFSSCDDPAISKTIDALMEKADEIVNQYKGKINKPDFTAQNLHDLLEKHQEILAGVEDIKVFSENSFNANMTLPEKKALYNKFNDFESYVLKKLTFLDLEIGKLIYKNPQLINEEVVSSYKHYLEKIRRKFPYKLSETEEQLILEKDQFGVNAWQQLKESWISTKKFKINFEGHEKIISFSEYRSLIEHPDRETRISVYHSVCGVLSKEQEIYSAVLRNICGDWVKTSKRRDYNSPIHQSLIENDTNQVIIDDLMKTIEKNIFVYQKFLRNKIKLLNLAKLDGVDIWAFLPSKKRYTWDEAKKINLQVYKNFDTSFGEIVNDIFERNHIDASTREGKVIGAYCSPWYNGKSAFILTPFTGLLSDILILTHELGHGIHFYFSSREQTFFNYWPTLTLAETASIFGELLMIDHLIETTDSTNEKISLLTNQLSKAGLLIFLLSAWMWFEQSLYDAIEKGEYLDGRTISKYWCAAREKIYGDSVEWFDDTKWEWIPIPQHFQPNFRFLNYPYVYAQIFVYALYKTYKNEGEKFVPKLKKLLSAGGSLSPEELGKIVGLDITKPDFWQLGMKQYEEFVDELEKLTK
ncbi:MAG: M3 family metallopeptidase [Candidatus Hodarchaeota archaeon]